MDSDGGAVRGGRGQRRGDRRRDVDHDHVAGLEQLGQFGERVVADRPVAAPGDQEAHLVAGEAASLGRLVSLERGLQLERERGHAGTARSGFVGELARPVAAARKIALDQPEQAGHAVLGRRAVRDVLAGERLLVHLRPHVAGVDRVDPQRRVLLGEDRGGLVERRLRGPVAAPAVVCLDGGIGADVDDHAAVRHAREDQLGEPDRGQDVDPVDALEHVKRIAAERRLGARPEHRRVVDEQVDVLAGGVDERSPVPVVGDVALERDDFGELPELARGPLELRAAAGVDHKCPAGARRARGPERGRGLGNFR